MDVSYVVHTFCLNTCKYLVVKDLARASHVSIVGQGIGRPPSNKDVEDYLT